MLDAYDQYWRGAPKIKTVVFRPIPDDAVRVAALQNGEIDVAVNIPPHLANIIANHPKIFLTTAPSHPDHPAHARTRTSSTPSTSWWARTRA